MALTKTGYKGAEQGTTKVNVAIDADGHLVPPGGTASGNKKFTITSVNADNGLTDNTEVLNFFIQLANGMSDSLSNTMAVTWSVDQYNLNS